MNTVHPLADIVRLREIGIPKGVCSICSANEFVIEAAFEKAREYGTFVLIEATANQVNQFGGYTEMKPTDFREFVFSIARKANFPLENIILGGDHLGPLVWKNDGKEQAMLKAEELVRDYVLAGFTKIHIDTSIKLSDDPPDQILDTKEIALRAARLCHVAESAFNELVLINRKAIQPVYVIGSEVPVPGGNEAPIKSGENESGRNESIISGESSKCEQYEELQITKVQDFEETVNIFYETFRKQGLSSVLQRIVGVVVQTGVEFGDNAICEYNRNTASQLIAALKRHPGLVFEGHSTDYQTPYKLKQMVEDGIAILKVGPALTFALREVLFALSHIEKELFNSMKNEPYYSKTDIKISQLVEVLDRVMLQQPDNWAKYYTGGIAKQQISRKYSYYDRCRYYLLKPEVMNSITILISNLKCAGIPLPLLSQYLPVQYKKVRNRVLENDPKAIIKDAIGNVIDNYMYATCINT
ncbi:MAG TPA: class II D-tagatose-bisphosphate aldolase, non-catalytic subunit [Clostridiales bacterium]|mgnify:CR=1 FL=1|nr:class II D-tagatose-bisphosphate aldolase, non-catalytic subunit [Clostridiales bacterium]